MTITTLMMDVDGVLVGGRPADGRHWASRLKADLGIEFEALQRMFFHPHWEEIVTGRAALTERLSSALAVIAPEVSTEALIAYWFSEDARLNDRLLGELGALRAEGYRVHLATNQEHRRARFLMQDLRLARHAEQIHYSAALGCRKPDPAFFRTITAKLGRPPAEFLLIDDSAENVAAARRAGWLGALWTGTHRLSELLAAAAESDIEPGD